MIDDDPLPDDERAAFDALPRAIDAPSPLEQRVVSQLHQHGLLRSPRRLSRSLALVAAVVIFFGGIALGRIWTTPLLPRAHDRYLLLLYGAATSSPAAEAARVSEYASWARDEAAFGRLDSGEKLDDGAVVLGGSGYGVEQPSGFFLIRAASAGEAEAIASRCPHLRHGGTVVVKRIADTR